MTMPIFCWMAEINYYIVDNNTQNHTYLNERRLEPSKPTLFHAGDTIRMADVVFNVIMGS